MLRIAAGCLLLACLLPHVALAQSDEEIDPAIVNLRSTNYPIDKYYVCLVAKSAFAERKWLRQGESISAYIRKKCGHEDADYIEIFQSIGDNIRNRAVSEGGQLVAKQDANYIFPACLYAQDWQRGLEGETPPTVHLKRDMTVKEIVDEYVGPRTDEKREKATRDIYADNPKVVPRLEGDPDTDKIQKLSVQRDSEVKLDVLLQPRDIKLDLSARSRAEFISQIPQDLTASDPDSFRKFNKCASSDFFRVPLEPIPLQDLFTGRRLQFGGGFSSTNTVNARVSGAKASPPHVVRFCAARTVEPLPEIVSRCDGNVTDDYPINWSAVTRAIELEELLQHGSDVAAVIITDTGLQGLDHVLVNNSSTFPARLPSDVFLRIKPEESDHSEAIGANWNKPGRSRYDPPFYNSGQPDMPHGTHIAGIILGQVGKGENADKEDAQHLALLRNRLKLFVVNVIKNDKSTDICDRQFSISEDYIKSSMGEVNTLARKAGLRIFNMSLETYQTMNRPMESENNLIVAAAGNAGIDFERSDQIALTTVYPAHWSSHLDNVISVGGHDGSRKLVIGNSGRDEVHLAAPACKINSLVGFENNTWRKGEMTGTSQSAALVTLAAALVYNLHGLSPQEIRWRLIDAADFELQLEAANFAGGVLNVGASLGATFDLVKLRKNNEVIFGRIIQSSVWGCPSSQRQSAKEISAKQVLVQTGNVRRVSYLYEGERPTEVHMLWGTRREAKRCVVPKDKQDEFGTSQLEFDEAVVVSEGAEKKVGYKARLIPLSEIREIVPRFQGSPPPGPYVNN